MKIYIVVRIEDFDEFRIDAVTCSSKDEAKNVLKWMVKDNMYPTINNEEGDIYVDYNDEHYFSKDLNTDFTALIEIDEREVEGDGMGVVCAYNRYDEIFSLITNFNGELPTELRSMIKKGVLETSCLDSYDEDELDDCIDALYEGEVGEFVDTYVFVGNTLN